MPRDNNPFEGKTPKIATKGDPDQGTVVNAPGKNLGGPGSWEAQKLASLAYPASSIKLSQMKAARAAFAKHMAARKALTGNGWSLVGPTVATQPAVLNFFDFQASNYNVSGRVTAMAVDPACGLSTCRLWIGAAGGGIWKTDNALASTPTWSFVSGSFGTNAIGVLTYDASTGTLYAGTGEANNAGDSEAGVGVYKSTDGGNTWSLLPGSPDATNARGINAIVVDPNHPNVIYVGTARAIRGVTAVTGGGVTLAPDAPAWGLYRSSNGGTSFSEIWDGATNGSRGVNHAELDSHGVLYMAGFGVGIWRTANPGASSPSWQQVFATQDAGDAFARSEFALATTNDGHTRIYVGDGGIETDTAFPPHSNTAVYRADAIDTKSSASLTDGTSNPGYTVLTDPANGRTDPTYDYCSGQCWYDNKVISPAGHPDLVYLLGSFDYNLYAYGLNDGRGILMSQDAGATWNDETRDAAKPTTGNHPDQHALVVNPANPLQFFEGSDGGVIRSSGSLKDASANCTTGFGGYTTTCQEMLSAVPTKLTPLNNGLSTLQFQGIAFNPVSGNHGTLIGGTQDNGTWLGNTGRTSWSQTIYGDGGVPLFDYGDSQLMMNEFYGQTVDANFEGGDPTKWVVISGPLFQSGEASEFYKPQIADPVTSKTTYIGLQSVWRTTDFGGDKTYLENNCPEFTTFADTAGCGDFKPLGDSSGNGGANSPSDLTGKYYGSTRQGGAVVAIARPIGGLNNKATMWAATATGRVFITRNVNAVMAGNVQWDRIDNATSAAPGRFVSGIVVDPKSPNRAWITYTGYNTNTPTAPGHVFQVVYNPSNGGATWTRLDRDNSLGDIPVNAIARDDSTGNLYVATDFGVLGQDAGTSSWIPVANGIPFVEVADLKIDQSNGMMYAGTHGRGIWKVALH